MTPNALSLATRTLLEELEVDVVDFDSLVDAEYYRVTYCRAVGETLHERLVACLFEHAPDDPPPHSASFVSTRALKVYLSLLELRERNVARLTAKN